jgi:hypothetical protein
MNKNDPKSTRDKNKTDAINKLRESKDKIKKESQLLSQKYQIHNKAKPQAR